jgi:tricorn protease-like protein
MTSRWIAVSLIVVSPLAAQQRRTVTHEDIWLMQRVSAPVLSPDGRWAVFSVTEPSYTESEQTSDLWLVPTDGSAPPRRPTSTRGGEGGATWSPDGRRVAFGARREGDEAGQLYVLDVADGGEARRVTSLSTGARAPLAPRRQGPALHQRRVPRRGDRLGQPGGRRGAPRTKMERPRVRRRADAVLGPLAR